MGVNEMPLPEQPDPKLFKPCPPEATTSVETAPCAEGIAKWVFKTYCDLVAYRLKIYNLYRRRYNKEAKPTPETLGLYRQACRLAREQILRRDLPYIPGLEWNFHHPMLPVFDVSFEVLERGTNPADADYEVVKKVKIRASVEGWQHNKAVSSITTMTPLDSEPEWSSSSSSSSSEFDPG
jgi:hypothetical protein